MGEITIIAPTKIPKGFRFKEASNSPLNNCITARVVPQEAHGIVVILLKIQVV